MGCRNNNPWSLRCLLCAGKDDSLLPKQMLTSSLEQRPENHALRNAENLQCIVQRRTTNMLHKYHLFCPLELLLMLGLRVTFPHSRTLLFTADSGLIDECLHVIVCLWPGLFYDRRERPYLFLMSGHRQHASTARQQRLQATTRKV